MLTNRNICANALQGFTHRVPPHDTVHRHAAAWRSLEAIHLSVNTMEAGLPSVDAHLEALRRIKEVIGA